MKQMPFLLLLFVLLANSCAQLNYLNDAQDIFNQGASLENQQTLSKFTTVETDLNALQDLSSSRLSSLSPASYYSLAYAEVKNALEKEAKLREDGVLGSALTLKALCEWKLELYAEASRSAQSALRAIEAGPVTLTRDQAVMTALDGLMDIDQAYTSFQALQTSVTTELRGPISTMDLLPLFDKVKAHYEENIRGTDGQGRISKGLRVIDRGRQTAAPGHEVQTYLIFAQLAGLKTWLDELDHINQLLQNFQQGREGSSLRAWFDTEKESYRTEKERYLQRLESVLPQGQEDPVYQQWSTLLFLA